MSLSSQSFILLSLAALSSCLEPDEFCATKFNLHGGSNVFRNPEDCHSYYECFFSVGTGQAIGQLVVCGEGTFWHETFQKCTVEGSKACQDPCRSAGLSDGRCMADPSNCRGYFQCSVGGAQQRCCPNGMSINEKTCRCEKATSCRDASCATDEQRGSNFGTYCIDAQGNKLKPGRTPKVYQIIADESTNDVTEGLCTNSSTFSLQKCGCTIPICEMYLPFDDDTLDHSGSNYNTQELGEVTISKTVKSRGSGSARFSGGAIEVAGFINDPDYFNSHCYMIRCLNPPCNYSRPAGFLSKRSTSPREGSLIGSIHPGPKFRFEIVCNSTHSLQREVPIGFADSTDFIAICGIFYGRNGAIWWNNNYIGTFDWPCNIPKNGAPMIWGFDMEYGFFDGYLDELLLCRRDIGFQGVDAYFRGQEAMRAAGLIV